MLLGGACNALLKMRFINSWLNNDIIVVVNQNRVVINSKLLADAIDTLQLKLDPKVLNPNKLKWEPVKALINMDTTVLTSHTDFKYKAIGAYIQNMKNLYQCLYSNKIVWTDRKKQMEICSKFLNLLKEPPTLQFIIQQLRLTISYNWLKSGKILNFGSVRLGHWL